MEGALRRGAARRGRAARQRRRRRRGPGRAASLRRRRRLPAPRGRAPPRGRGPHVLRLPRPAGPGGRRPRGGRGPGADGPRPRRAQAGLLRAGPRARRRPRVPGGPGPPRAAAGQGRAGRTGHQLQELPRRAHGRRRAGLLPRDRGREHRRRARAAGQAGPGDVLGGRPRAGRRRRGRDGPRGRRLRCEGRRGRPLRPRDRRGPRARARQGPAQGGRRPPGGPGLRDPASGGPHHHPVRPRVGAALGPLRPGLRGHTRGAVHPGQRVLGHPRRCARHAHLLRPLPRHLHGRGVQPADLDGPGPGRGDRAHGQHPGLDPARGDPAPRPPAAAG